MELQLDVLKYKWEKITKEKKTFSERGTQTDTKIYENQETQTERNNNDSRVLQNKNLKNSDLNENVSKVKTRKRRLQDD